MAQDTTTLGALFHEPRDVGWHSFKGARQFGGEPGGPNVSQALVDMDLDFTVETAPMFTVIDGVTLPVPGKNAIVRTGNRPMIYGTTGASYGALQNMQVGEMLDPLVAKYPLDTIASAGDGRDLLVVLKGDPVEVNGDQLQEFIYFLDSKDGLRSVQCAITDVRLWCTNQLITGLKAASFQAQVKHTEGVAGTMGYHLQIMQLLEIARRQLHQSFEAMGTKRLTTDELKVLLARVFPDPVIPKRVQLLHTLATVTAQADGTLDEEFRNSLEPEQLAATDAAQVNYEALVRQVPILRKDAMTLYEKFGDEHTAYGGTGWAFFNAIVEMADFRGNRGTPEAIARSALFGDRAREKERAFVNTMDLVDPSWNKSVHMAEALANSSSARRTAAMQLREQARQAAAVQREQRAAEKYAEDVASGKIKQRLDAEGNVLPPMTAADRLEEQIAREEARLLEAQNKLEARRAALLARRGEVAENRAVAAQEREAVGHRANKK